MFSKFTNYLKASQKELKKVTWPTREETTNHTILVVGISLAMAAFLGTIDWLLTKILETLI